MCVGRASYEVEVATVCFSVLGLHYTFATNFLVSLFDEKLSRREIDPTNFLQRSSRPPPPGCPLVCSRESIETGQGMIECKRPNDQIQRATEVESVELIQRRARRSTRSLARVGGFARLPVGTLYKSVKMLWAKRDYSKRGVVNTSLVQASKCKE